MVGRTSDLFAGTVGGKRQYVRHRIAAGIVAGLMVGFVGCSQSGPAVQFVEGRVLLDGKPIAGATVGFGPVNPAAGLAAAGTTNAEGVFQLTASGGGAPGRGTLPGEYVVTVLKLEQSQGKSLPTPDDPDYGKSADPSVPTPAGGPPKYVVPEAYSKPETSGLKATVKPGRNTGDGFVFSLDASFKG
jgi:hypothetical protein